MPVVPFDPAYPVGAGSSSPASFGASPGTLQNPAAFGGQAVPFAAGMGGIMPGPGYQLPPLQNPGYNPGGGFMPTPIGGTWNQIAQQMAGPLYMPAGTSALAGAPNPVMPMQQSAATVPGFTPTPGSNYLAPNLYMPTTPIKTAPKPVVSMPNTSPVQIPAGTPLIGNAGAGAGLGAGGSFGGGGTRYSAPRIGLSGISRF